MSRHALAAGLAACLVAGCAGVRPGPPVEMLDERTGLTVAALQAPLELTPRGLPVAGRRPGFAWLGPVEWNRMGHFTEGLWVHVAPGQGTLLADIRERGALALVLDDGELELHTTDAPALAHDPYRAATSWGQTAYFDMTVRDLRRIAASSRLALRCAGADGVPVSFDAPADTRPVLDGYLKARGLTGD